ncbi:MAG: putative MetA-pathway of phenol degradation [Cyanobacteria bacterium RYN_339]|nr:putative MetA-pathway of phenol degradation [Cyanobacteria bacterium RYN_339]
MEETYLRNFAPFTALAFAAILAFPTAALAEHIHSDAPDAATGTFIVPLGVYQLEQNVQVDMNAGVPSLGFPSLHRFGLSDTVELRVESPILAFTQATGVQREWVALEGKWNIEKLMPAGLPALALFGTARLEANNQVTPAIALLADIQLPLETGLNANLGGEFPSSGPALTYAASVGHKLYGDNWAIYGEVAGGYDPTNSLGANVDGGVKYRVDDDTQVMLAAGTDALKPGTTYYVTTNYSHRWGKY